MSSKDWLSMFESLGVVATNTHVVYTSGRHGSAYVNKDAVYPHTSTVSTLCEHIAEYFKEDEVEVVAAPAVGGIILSQWVAHHLTLQSTEALAVFAEKGRDDKFEFRRGYDQIIGGRRVLVVEDILTTGTSLRKVIEAVRATRGSVVGAAALCNRGRVKAEEIGDPGKFYCLAEIDLNSWEAGECPLCAAGVPINVDVGKGREFLAAEELGPGR